MDKRAMPSGLAVITNQSDCWFGNKPIYLGMILLFIGVGTLLALYCSVLHRRAVGWELPQDFQRLMQPRLMAHQRLGQKTR